MTFMTVMARLCPRSEEAEGVPKDPQEEPLGGRSYVGGGAPRLFTHPGKHTHHWRQPRKDFLNPPGNAIFRDPWECNRNDNFLENELGPYIRRLAYHPGIVPDFVLSNPIGNRPLGPGDEVFRKLYMYAKLNKLFWKLR